MDRNEELAKMDHLRNKNDLSFGNIELNQVVQPAGWKGGRSRLESQMEALSNEVKA